MVKWRTYRLGSHILVTHEQRDTGRLEVKIPTDQIQCLLRGGVSHGLKVFTDLYRCHVCEFQFIERLQNLLIEFNW